LALVLVLASAPAPSAAATRVGSELQVNSYTTYGQSPTGIAVHPDGSFVVVWGSSGDRDGSQDAVLGQRFDGSGARLGAEFIANTATLYTQDSPDVAANGAGEFVIVWRSYGQDGGMDDYGYLDFGVFAQRFTANGAPQGPEFQVNLGEVNGPQDSPAIARSTAGDFVVVWRSGSWCSSTDYYYDPYLGYGYTYCTGYSSADGSGDGVRAQRFDASGTAVGPELTVNTYTSGAQNRASIARGGNGHFIVVWDSFYQDGDWIGLMGQRFDAAMVPQGSEFQVNTWTTSAQGNAGVAADGSGGFVVVWQSYGQPGGHYFDVFAQRFAASGAALGGEFMVNTYTSGQQFAPRVAMKDDGFVVVWAGEDGNYDGVFGQRFSGSGARLGGEFQVNAWTTESQNGPVVGMNTSGRFVVAWRSYLQDGHDTGVFGQRFDFAVAREADGKALDFHADAMADLVWYNKVSGQAYLWKMNGGTATAFNSIGTVPLDWSIVAGGDFGGDGKTDLVWYNKVTGHTYLWQMNGHTATSTTPIALVGDLAWQIQATGDTDGDGKADMIWQNQSTGAVYVWRMNGSTMLSTLPVATVGDLDWRILGARDFNGDGKSDLLWKNKVTGQVYVWIMNGAAYTPVLVTTVGDLNWKVVAGGDFNADGRSDLVWHHSSTGQVYLWTMNGGTILSVLPVTTVGDLNWTIVASGRFNSDSRHDLLWYNKATGQTYVWIMNGASTVSVNHVNTVGDLNWGPLALH
jgi:hypothetical protein